MLDEAERELLARTIAAAVGQGAEGSLDAVLDELGWRDALAVDRRAAVAALFEPQGARHATSTALDAVVLSAVAVDAPPTAVALPPLGAWHPPAEIEGDRATVSGLVLGREVLGDVLVVGRLGDDHIAFVTDALGSCSVGGIDASLAIRRIDATVLVHDPRPVAWSTAAAAAQLALAHELVGCARSMLTLAREHALDREQFGRPIATFQAVRHRLAETLVAVEGAASAIEGAWDDGLDGSAAMAKAIAGRAALTATRHCQQVLAGIGFTTEHPLHRFIRRALVLDQLFGSSATLTRHLGRELISSRALPPRLPL